AQDPRERAQRRAAEVARDRREGDVDDEQVEARHEDARRHDQRDAPLARETARGRRRLKRQWRERGGLHDATHPSTAKLHDATRFAIILSEMLRNDYDSQICSIAGALEVVCERWSLLIVRDVLLGMRRFDELQSNLGIARNVLQTRLERLLEHGVLEKRRYRERPER